MKTTFAGAVVLCLALQGAETRAEETEAVVVLETTAVAGTEAPEAVVVTAAATEAGAQPPAAQPGPLVIAAAAKSNAGTETQPQPGAISPETPAEVAAKSEAQPLFTLRPFVAIVGGFKPEYTFIRPTLIREPRLTTLMLSRFGLKAHAAGWLYVESEFEVNAGFHGTSAWEGQASLQVRNQFVRMYGKRWKLELGRVTDEASVDYYSAHVADFLMADPFTRDPFLFTGYNRGNGVLGAYEVLDGLTLGLTFNAANPVAMTGSLAIGGTYPPFERFYQQPWQAVNQFPNHTPDDSFQMYIAAPSLQWKSERLEAQAEVQLFRVDLNANRNHTIRDANLLGFNARGGVRAKLGSLTPFLNIAYDQNDVADPANLTLPATYDFYSLTFGGGLDWNYAGANGVGVQYMRIQHQAGSLVLTSLQYVNLGTTYWVHPQVSLGARLALGLRHEHRVGAFYEGETAAYLTVRALLL